MNKKSADRLQVCARKHAMVNSTPHTHTHHQHGKSCYVSLNVATTNSQTLIHTHATNLHFNENEEKAASNCNALPCVALYDDE